LLPQAGSGKVKTGQRVHIKFDGYPYTEFGMVLGSVQTFSQVARDDVYQIDVGLPRGLTTTYDKELAFKYNMQGSAEIITREMRLIERIFNQFRHLVDKNT
jgi:hypothetical protein